MQALDPAGYYTDDEVRAALSFEDGARTITYRFDRLDSSNRFIEPLGSVLSCEVSNNMLADIKRTAKLTLLDNGALDYLKDRVRPWARLQMPADPVTPGGFGVGPFGHTPFGHGPAALGGTRPGYVEWPLGVFLLTSPSRRLVRGTYITRDVEAYDQLVILRDDKTADRYVVAAGAVYTTVLGTIAAAEGLVANITPSALTVPITMEWEPGTSYLRIVNDLLAAINYESAWFDELGRLVCRPYQSPQTKPSEYTYATDDTSVIAGDIDQTLDLYGVPNKWVLVKSEPDAPALTSTYTNTDPASPTSTVSRGRTIVDFGTEADAADQATLDALVARRAFEASQVYEVVEFNTALMPLHSNADVLTITIPALGVSAKYSEHEWSAKLETGALMSHRVRRVVNV